MRNEIFGWNPDHAMVATLLSPAGIEQSLLGTLDLAGYTVFDIPELDPYALLVITPDLLPGDYNHDGIVNAADHIVWRDTLGSITDLRADGNSDGIIDYVDYEYWKTRFGNTTTGNVLPAAEVPEPVGFVTMMFGVVLTVFFVRGLPCDPESTPGKG